MLTRRLAPSFRKPLIAAISIVLCAPANALELNAATTLTARHSNNTFRSENDQKNNFSLEPGILLDGMHDGPNLQAALNYQFERRFHTEDGNSQRNFFRGGADIDWMLIPDRLEINLDQSSTESTRSASQSGTENDREVTDNLSVGPTLFFRVRDTDRLSFTYLFEDRNGILDENDSTSNIFSGSYTFQFSEFSSLTAEHREEDIDFSSDLARQLDATKQTLSYAYRNEGVWLQITGGRSEYEREGAEAIEGDVGEFNLRKEAGLTSFTLFARREITNQSSRLFQSLEDINFDDFILFIDANIAEVFIETGYGFGVTQEIGATQVRFSADVYKYDYESLVADRDEYLITLGAERRVNRNMSFDVAARYRVSEDDDLPGTPLAPADLGERNKLFVIRGELDWDIASNFNLGVGVEYRNNASGYNETVSYATATYALFRRR